MVRIKPILTVIALVIFFTITTVHSCSNRAKSNTYNLHEGERLLSSIKKSEISKNIISIDGFKYVDIEILFFGDMEEYKKFILDYGYEAVNTNLYCKNGNSIRLSPNNQNTLLIYKYNNSNCK